MSRFANKSRITLIRFGKVCPFVLCFVVLVSDVENIIAILTDNIIEYDGVAIYNTPLSFSIGEIVEYDIFVVFTTTVISFAIEACIYNVAANFYLFIVLLRKYYLFTHEPFDDSVYLIIMFLCSIISICFVLKGIKILISK